MPSRKGAEFRSHYDIHARVHNTTRKVKYVIRHETFDMLIKSIKVLTSEWLAILLVTSLRSTSYILKSKALTQEDEESGYLKYASQLIKDSNNSSTSKNATTIPIPQAAKGPPIPAKGPPIPAKGPPIPAKGYLV